MKNLTEIFRRASSRATACVTARALCGKIKSPEISTGLRRERERERERERGRERGEREGEELLILLFGRNVPAICQYARVNFS